jgi:hypothetical protein
VTVLLTAAGARARDPIRLSGSSTVRVLDIDLDAFVEPPAHWTDHQRLDPDEHYVWPVEQAFAWLTDRCQLDAARPGWAVEHHVEIFDRWHDAIETGQLAAPFHFTHLDAHADLGLGASGYAHLLTDLVHRPVEQRTTPKRGDDGLHSGNFLAYAIGCRWITDVDYVFGPGGGSDLMPYLMDGYYDVEHGPGRKDLVRLPHLWPDDIDHLLYRHGRPSPTCFEPAVGFRSTRTEHFRAADGYDIVCLTRSPDYTPPTADALYDAIRNVFIAGPPGSCIA